MGNGQGMVTARVDPLRLRVTARFGFDISVTIRPSSSDDTIIAHVASPTSSQLSASIIDPNRNVIFYILSFGRFTLTSGQRSTQTEPSRRSHWSVRTAIS